MSDDPREKALTDAYIQFIEESKYNRHFAGVPEQAVMESRLFLRLWDSLSRQTDRMVGKGTLTWKEPEGRAFKEGEEIVISPLPMYHIFCLTTTLYFMRLGVTNVLITNPRDLPAFIEASACATLRTSAPVKPW